jgi:uncharacterized protein (DUF2141 family)
MGLFISFNLNKYILIVKFLIVPFFLAFSVLTVPKKEIKLAKYSLQIEVSNVKKDRGSIMLAVHNRANFLKSRLVEQKIPTNQTSCVLKIDLEEGEYAVAVFQDENNNQKLDTNMFGVPQEPYGFSNNARPKLRAPTFDEAKISLWGQSKLVQIRLDSW